MTHYADEVPRVHYIFSEVKGIYHTTLHYHLYYELNPKEISDKLHYSSVAHLTNQFKKNYRLSPTFFKQLKLRQESALENKLTESGN